MGVELGDLTLGQIVQADPGVFAAHRVPHGWEIIAPSSDPFTPACRTIAALNAYGRQSGCGHERCADHVAA
jgi:hypothetical protein